MTTGTRSLKFIGGAWDGRTEAVEECQREYVVREHLPQLLQFNFDPNHIPEPTVSYHQTLYVLDRVHCSNDEYVEFMRPANWSRWQVLRHVFGA